MSFQGHGNDGAFRRSAGGPGYSTHGKKYPELETEDSTLQQVKKTYYTAKQVVMKKMGKKQDSSVVASDAQLDAKLELFKQIKKSSHYLLKVIEAYLDRLTDLARAENGMGHFLRGNGSEDHTRAGKMLLAVGKSQGFCAQQRLLLHDPLKRLRAEVETFVTRVIKDMEVTVDKMEYCRNEYRGDLMWMKKVSEQLDPEAFKQMENYRRVQQEVRKSKARFDRLKLGVMQKVDMLAASRSNMFSHALLSYQRSMLTFWQRTAKTMSHVSDAFQGYQYYEFNMLKELDTTSKELAEKTAGPALVEPEPIRHVPDDPTPPATNEILSPEVMANASAPLLEPLSEEPEDEVIREIIRILNEPLKKPQQSQKKFRLSRFTPTPALAAAAAATDGKTTAMKELGELINFNANPLGHQGAAPSEATPAEGSLKEEELSDSMFGEFQAAESGTGSLVDFNEGEIGEYAKLLGSDTGGSADDSDIAAATFLKDVLSGIEPPSHGPPGGAAGADRNGLIAMGDSGAVGGSDPQSDDQLPLSSQIWASALAEASASLLESPVTSEGEGDHRTSSDRGPTSLNNLAQLSLNSSDLETRRPTNGQPVGPASGVDHTAGPSLVLPSQLLDAKDNAAAFTSTRGESGELLDFAAFGGQTDPSGTEPSKLKAGASAKKDSRAEWLTLFSELDPLGNPDTIGRQDVEAGNA